MVYHLIHEKVESRSVRPYIISKDQLGAIIVKVMEWRQLVEYYSKLGCFDTNILNLRGNSKDLS